MSYSSMPKPITAKFKAFVLSAICAVSLSGCETLYEIAEVYADESASQQTYTKTRTYTPSSTSTYNGYTPSSTPTSSNTCTANCLYAQTAAVSYCHNSYENEHNETACETRAKSKYSTCKAACPSY